MHNLKEREQVIEYSKKLNTTNLSPLRSGNISVRGIQDDVEGFFITPSGKKYEALKPDDIVFLSLNEEKDFLSWFSSCTFAKCYSCIYSWKSNTTISLYDSTRWR